jgi:L-seryl-tRNA(Ser) seleniumtransferase
MLETEKRELLRSLPAVDAVLRVSATEALVSRYGRAGVTAAVREALRRAREEILNGGEPPVSEEGVLAIAARILSGRGIRRVVNATGVVLHTNLGRSVLSERAVEAVLTTATSYSVVAADIPDAEVVVSRGQLIEIGGGFRIPEVLKLSGARLREVGTTNRTRLSDYEGAINENTSAILWVHPSNFKVVGFAESVGVAELTSLGLPVVADVGSGALLAISDEPKVETAVRDGAALTIFSGDKLLGGPQAGIAVGELRWISAMRRHPLVRALRADKLCLAALEATLTAYLEGNAREELPTLKMLHAPAQEIKARADRLAGKLCRIAPGLAVDVVPSVVRSGGGTLPLYEVPSYAVRLAGDDALAGKLRAANPPVVGRVGEGRLWLDVRTLLQGDEEAILSAVEASLG